MSLGVLLLGVVFTFHVFALHMASRQQRISENYRRIVTSLDKVETMLANADVYKVDATNIVFAEYDQDHPISRRFPRRDPQMYTLSVQDDGLVMRHAGESQTLLTLKPWEQISFALYWDDDFNQTKRYIDIIASGNPPVTSAREGTEQPFSLVRRVYIEPQY